MSRLLQMSACLDGAQPSQAPGLKRWWLWAKEVRAEAQRGLCSQACRTLGRG